MLEPFHDATDLLDDAAALRERARRDGTLFFRGLLPVEPVRELRAQVLAVCEQHGFLQAGSALEDALAAPGVRWREGDAEYMAAYDEIQRLEAFHALAHQPELLAALETLLGEAVLVHPRNIARVMFPQNNAFTTPPHQDYAHIQGTEETWTVWIPLGDCPRLMGGVEVLVGSHRGGVRPVHAAQGAGGLGVATDDPDLSWAGGDFRCGDALFFQSLCVHRGVPNRTPERVRLSVDYRYQGVSQPVVASSLLPHFNRVPWEEIYQGWERTDLQYYWKKFDLNLVEWSPEWHRSAGRR